MSNIDYAFLKEHQYDDQTFSISPHVPNGYDYQFFKHYDSIRFLMDAMSFSDPYQSESVVEDINKALAAVSHDPVLRFIKGSSFHHWLIDNGITYYSLFMTIRPLTYQVDDFVYTYDICISFHRTKDAVLFKLAIEVTDFFSIIPR